MPLFLSQMPRVVSQMPPPLSVLRASSDTSRAADKSVLHRKESLYHNAICFDVGWQGFLLFALDFSYSLNPEWLITRSTRLKSRRVLTRAQHEKQRQLTIMASSQNLHSTLFIGQTFASIN